MGLRELVRQALRMRPDRLVVGEFRGAEMVELLVALNTGHEGSAATLHANSAADVPARFAALGALAGLPGPSVTSLVASAIDVVVHLRRGRDGRRTVAEIGLVERVGDELVVEPAWSAAHGEQVRRRAAASVARSGRPGVTGPSAFGWVAMAAGLAISAGMAPVSARVGVLVEAGRLASVPRARAITGRWRTGLRAAAGAPWAAAAVPGAAFAAVAVGRWCRPRAGGGRRGGHGLAGRA